MINMDILQPSPVIKVMVITPTLECGGAERFVSLLCNNNDPGSLQISLVVINNAHPFYKITSPFVKTTDLGIHRVSRSFFKLAAAIKSVKPDIVFSTANHLNLYVAIFRSLIPGKIIWVARESSIVSINSKYSRHAVFYNWLLKTLYKRLDHIICQSAYMQQDLVKNYHIDINKTSIIYNAVDPALHYQEKAVKKNTFITVARLSAEKGIDTLLKIVAPLNIPFVYYIIGDGPEKEDLKKLAVSLGISNQVHFTGTQDQPFAGKEDSHLYLMGSLYEGFPNAVMEANALGIPAVAKNAPGGISEIIKEGDNGFLAADENDFRKKILIATAYQFDRKQISESANQKFNISKMTRSISELFSKLYSLKKK